ncbi:DNA polymerase III subunit gamma/tau [Patescibacteria group bacterium]|nr:DNA polymerase III subunit gamma/tau [Patescibacteria group bacterium]
MAQALYRKYRPTSFSELINQNPIRVTLQNEIENDRVAHAYLFSGPRGVGKTTIARLLAKTVNCTKRQGAEPCNSCDICQESSAGRSLDIIEIDAASHTGVDNVRENIIENARFTPQRAKFKVFIIDEVHMLSISAFNALLKTLEEPPEHVIFILATTEIHRVPETIISRCQRFDFKRVGVDDLVQRLQFIAGKEKVEIEDALLRNIARRAEGSVRDAEVLLGQILSLGDKKITEEKASIILPRSNVGLLVELFKYLIHNDAQEAITLVNRLVEEGVNLQDFTKDYIEFLRQVLLLKVNSSAEGLSDLALDKQSLEEVKNYIKTLSVSQLVSMIEIFSAKLQDLRYAHIIQLPLELAILEITDNDETPTDDTPATPTSKNNMTSKKKSDPASDKSVKNSSQSSLVSLDKVKKIWPEAIDKLKESNRSISLSLKVGIPQAVNGSQVVIAYQHKFHAERVTGRIVKSKIEDVLTDLAGKKLSILTEVLTPEEFAKLDPLAVKADTAENPGILEQALHAFGGEVVEEE